MRRDRRGRTKRTMAQSSPGEGIVAASASIPTAPACLRPPAWTRCSVEKRGVLHMEEEMQTSEGTERGRWQSQTVIKGFRGGVKRRGVVRHRRGHTVEE
jgi:hypothetical protein